MVDTKIIDRENHIGFLDILRGFLAFWVYYGHLKMASIGREVFLGTPALAVDGFMILSGFLMAYHWARREKKFSTFWAQVKDFYLRRFFRIAPLYYLLVSIEFLWQTKLFSMKNAVNKVVSPAWAGIVVNFDNPVVRDINLANIISHYSFTFGLIPRFANSNLIPDWSISLEMQFYLLFPFIVLLITRFGSFSVTFFSLLAAIATNKFFGLYLDKGILWNFPQPSFILFKINFFLAGMALAYAYLSKDAKRRIAWLFLVAISLYDASTRVQIIAAALTFMLMLDFDKNEIFNRIGSWKISKFFSDTSYSLYLLHLLIMYPILNILFQQDWYFELSTYTRFFMSLAIISPIVYGLSYLLHRTIEIPGILLGKKVASLGNSQRS
ncbi:MAG: acyltransferase [Anaerolineales bacterium]|nr:acyltransferase [Anaerolineales bacterium]